MLSRYAMLLIHAAARARMLLMLRAMPYYAAMLMLICCLLDITFAADAADASLSLPPIAAAVYAIHMPLYASFHAMSHAMFD